MKAAKPKTPTKAVKVEGSVKQEDSPPPIATPAQPAGEKTAGRKSARALEKPKEESAVEPIAGSPERKRPRRRSAPLPGDFVTSGEA